MKKSDFLKVCEDHAVNPRAMKRRLHEDGLYRKTATKYEVLRCMMIHCTDLMFCRQSDYENEVEYADKHAPSRLIDAMLSAEKEVEE
jgi:hypothetical protein